MTQRSERGFTLIELLVAVAIVGIVAGIAAPQLLRARSAGNEAAAVASLRAIHSGQASYASTCARGGYAQTLDDLARLPVGGSSGFVSPDLSRNGVVKSGYVLNVGSGVTATVILASANTCNGAADDALASYFGEAHPTSVGSTGQRSFGLDQRGTVFQEPTGVTFTNVFPASATPIQ
jgi:type IV pilus assembly protein PilA